MSKPFTASDDVVPGETYQAGYREGYDNALAEQHVEIERLRARLSLAERSITEFKADRNDIIEECALAVVRIGPKPFHEIVAAIRALKDKP